MNTIQHSLLHDIALLSLDDDGNLMPLDKRALDCVLAAAIMIELSENGRIQCVDDRIILKDLTLSGDLWTDRAVRRLFAEEETHSLEWWLEQFIQKPPIGFSDIFENLANKQILRREDHDVAWVFRNVAYAILDDKPEREATLRLLSALLGDNAELYDQRLAGLAAAAGILPELFTDRMLRAVQGGVKAAISADIYVAAAMNTCERLRATATHSVAATNKAEIWEWRAFWHDDKLTPLTIETITDFSRDKLIEEQVTDIYLIADGLEDNIKLRNGKGVQIKIRTQRYKEFVAFRPKQDISFPFKASRLLRSIPAMKNNSRILRSAIDIHDALGEAKLNPRWVMVEKQRFRTSLPDGTALEFARLMFGDRAVWSACVEGQSLAQVTERRRHFLPRDAMEADYLTYILQHANASNIAPVVKLSQNPVAKISKKIKLSPKKKNKVPASKKTENAKNISGKTSSDKTPKNESGAKGIIKKT